MNKNLNDLLMIDQKIGDFLYDNNTLSDSELNTKFEETGYVSKAIKLLSKLSNKGVLEVIKRSSYLNNFIDIKKFLKGYPLNKTYLKNNKEMYIEEYKKLKNTCIYLSNISLDFNEFQEYMRVLDIDGVEFYLLCNMPNEQIYELSHDTGDWMQKLYYFSFLKPNKLK